MAVLEAGLQTVLLRRLTGGGWGGGGGWRIGGTCSHVDIHRVVGRAGPCGEWLPGSPQCRDEQAGCARGKRSWP
ncbi:hypothetical protein SNL152K_9044 [Streptomyces sp. NL15-2K]|nr:hypothetical protein SNL152K_9044 [Streptomyces sp. NL15-2K]